MQRGSPIQEHGVVLDYCLQNIPNLLVLTLQHFLGTLDRIGMSEFLELADNERLIQLQRDFFRQTTLVQLQGRPYDNYTPGRIIDAFAQQVFAEAKWETYFENVYLGNYTLEEIATLPLPIGGAKATTTTTTAKTTTTTQTPITTTAQPSETTGAHKASEKASSNLLLLTAVALAIVAIAVAIAVLKRK